MLFVERHVPPVGASPLPQGEWCVRSVVIPLQLKHHFVLGRGQMAELALGAQAQSEIAGYFPLLIQTQATTHFTIGEKITLGFQAQVAHRVFPQHTTVETGGRGNECGEVVVVLDTHGAQGKAEQIVAQLPGTAAATVDVADQGLVIMLARYPFQTAGDLP